MGNDTWVDRLLRGSIWRPDIQRLAVPRAVCIRSARTFILAVHGFVKNNSIRTAAVLTYYSLLNFIPLIAVLFAIAKGFGLKRMIQNYVLQMADNANIQPDMAQHIITFSNSLLQHAKSGIMAGIGTALLLWTVISILGRIEESLNAIWHVHDSRSITRRAADYISMLVCFPVMFAVSLSASMLLSNELKSLLADVTFSRTLNYGTILALNVLPFISMWGILMVLYIVMPNTRVPVGSGMLAAIIAGTGFQVLQFTYIKVQFVISSYGAIYGSFAAIPLFLGWLQLSWMLVLFGAEISHAANYVETFGLYPDYSRITGTSRKLFVLRIFHLIVKRFDLGQKPLGAECIARELKIPLKVVQEILKDLKRAGLLVDVIPDRKAGILVQPARSIENITIGNFFDMYERSGDPLPDISSPEVQTFREYIDEVYRGTQSRIKDL